MCRIPVYRQNFAYVCFLNILRKSTFKFRLLIILSPLRRSDGQNMMYPSVIIILQCQLVKMKPSFSCQKFCIRVMSSIFKTFVNFLTTKSVNNYLNNTKNNFPWRFDKINFNVQRQRCKHGSNLIIWWKVKVFQTRETVFHRHIQTPRRQLTIRRAAEYFWQNSRCLNSRWKTVSSVWYIFSIETKTTE